MKPTYTVVQK